MKIFKVLVVWVIALAIPLFAAQAAASNNVDWVVDMSLTMLYGYFLLVSLGGIVKLGLGWKLDEIVWLIAGLNLLALILGPYSLPFAIASFLGIAVCYGALRMTRSLWRGNHIPAIET